VCGYGGCNNPNGVSEGDCVHLEVGVAVCPVLRKAVTGAERAFD
jgi:hypothetical protein